MKARLEVGDVIRVHNPLITEDRALYPVLCVEGNRARTTFRTFNTRVWHGKYVYEFGKRASVVYNNTYTVEAASRIQEPTCKHNA